MSKGKIARQGVKMPKKRFCGQCQTPFSTPNKWKRFCSPRCRFLAWQKRRHPSICPNCGKEF